MADDTPKRVLYAAGPIFAEKGYEAATVREICKAAGVNVASVNYHFGDKETLYLETIKLAHTLRLQQVPPPVWPDSAAPEEKLRQIIHTMISRMLGTREMGWQTQLMMREMFQPTAACQHLVEEFIRPQHNVLLGVLDELLPTDVEPHTRQQLALSIVGQCFLYRVAREFVELLIPKDEREKNYRMEQLAQHVTEFSLSALSGYTRDGSNGLAGRSSAMPQLERVESTGE
jgi:AcrR family transcriptional regulator